jgi:hypothetical protein
MEGRRGSNERSNEQKSKQQGLTYFYIFRKSRLEESSFL